MGSGDRLSASSSPRVVTPAGVDDALWRPHLEALTRRAFGEVAREIGFARGARLLVVSAHPDDETLGGGRFIADWVRGGGEAYGVTATAGEACFDEVGYHHQSLQETRMAEWRAALGVLGVAPVGCLALPDGGVAGHLESLTDRLREIVDDVQPDVIAGTLDADPHPDHAAVGIAVRQIADDVGIPSIEWPIWLTYFGTPPAPEGMEIVECSEHAAAARSQAWECFDSQRRPVSCEVTAVVPPEMVESLRDQLVVRRIPA